MKYEYSSLRQNYLGTYTLNSCPPACLRGTTYVCIYISSRLNNLRITSKKRDFYFVLCSISYIITQVNSSNRIMGTALGSNSRLSSQTNERAITTTSFSVQHNCNICNSTIVVHTISTRQLLLPISTLVEQRPCMYYIVLVAHLLTQLLSYIKRLILIASSL